MDGTELNLSVIAKQFSDEETAYLYMESIRWPNGPICPHCGSVNHAYFLKPRAGQRTTTTGKVSYRHWWKCADCRKQFSVTVGTIFERSHIPLSKWLLAYFLLCANKNGVAALELSRVLDLSYEAAWFMAHRIRTAMELPEAPAKLTGMVEADETYIGGKARGGKRGRGAANKTPVVTLVQRDGAARSRVMHHVTGKNIGEVLSEQMERDAILLTDELNVYTAPGKAYAAHETVAHGEGEYARTADVDGAAVRVHINTAEGFFSQLKRSLDGTHHHVSEQHLHRYLAEFDYRYSARKMRDGERTVQAIRQAAGKRLRYEQAIAPTPPTD